MRRGIASSLRWRQREPTAETADDGSDDERGHKRANVEGTVTARTVDR